MGRQAQRILYQAIDEDSGKEVVGIELRRGLMTEEQMKKDEGTLLPVLIDLLQTAQAGA